MLLLQMHKAWVLCHEQMSYVVFVAALNEDEINSAAAV